MSFRPRFSLRTLLIFVTVSAVASWAYWIGWPWWLVYREQVRFEADVTRLKASISIDEARALERYHGENGAEVSIGEYPDKLLRMHSWPNAAYYVLYQFERPYDPNCKISKVEVFRTPPVPAEARAWRLNPTPEYVANFFRMIGGDRKDARGFTYELIYSDPPPISD